MKINSSNFFPFLGKYSSPTTLGSVTEQLWRPTWAIVPLKIIVLFNINIYVYNNIMCGPILDPIHFT